MERVCNQLIGVLYDEMQERQAFADATAAIDVAADGAPLDRDLVRTQTSADAVKNAVQAREQETG
jgi:hypothetical protein